MRHFSLFFLLISLNLFSQTFKLKGKITDSLQQPLAFANIMSEFIGTDIPPVFGISDEDGNYMIRLKGGLSYKITVYYLGYETYHFKIDSISKNLTRNIILREMKNQLDEVIIDVEMPVTVREDTITYKVERFTNGRERKLKDVLKKLPGIEVDRKGHIKSMGNDVNILLVDNKLFFGGGTKLGVDNIPADVINKVEVLNDYNAVPFMKGLNRKKITAINIQLKKGKKKFYFGDITGGIGNDNHYVTHANIFYYSPQTRMNFIGNMNNVGQEALTAYDFIRMEAGDFMDFSNFSESFEAINWLTRFMRSPYYIDKQQKLGAFQLQNSLKNGWDVNTYFIFLKDKITTHNTQNNYYLLSGINQNINEFSRQNFLMGKAKLALKKKLSDSNYFEINMNSAFSGEEEKQNTLYEVSQEDDFIDENYISSYFSYDFTLKWNRRLNERNTFAIKSKFNIEKDSPEKNWESSIFYLDEIIHYLPDSKLSVTQNTDIEQYKWMLEGTHYFIINSHNHIYTTIGNYLLKEKFYSEAFQNLSDGLQYTLLDNDFYSRLNRDLTDTYLGLTFRTKINLTTIKASIYSHYYYSRSQNTNLLLNKISFLPEISLETKIHYTQELNFDYRLTNKISEGSILTDAYYFKDYSLLFRGNSQLVNAGQYTHKMNLRYKSFKLMQDFLLYASVSYSYTPKPVIDMLYYYGADSFLTPIQIDLPKQSFGFSGTYKRLLNYWYASLGYRLGLNYYSQKIQNQDSDVNADTHIVQLKWGNKHKKWPNMEATIKWRYNKKVINQSLLETKSWVFEMKADYEFFNFFYANIDFRSVKNISKNSNDSFTSSELSVSYNKDNLPWSIELNVLNIFDTSYNQRFIINEIIMNDSKFYVKPRLFLLKLEYKL